MATRPAAAHGDSVLTSFRPHQQQIRDIYCRDQQKQGRSAKQCEQDRLDRPDDYLAQRHDVRKLPGIRIRILRLKVPPDYAEIGRCRIERRIVFQPPDTVEIMATPALFAVVVTANQAPNIRLPYRSEMKIRKTLRV